MNNREGKRTHEAVRWRSKGERFQLECRECEVICERVVSPWDCLRSQCPYIYAFREGEKTYFGCLHKVFAPELDLSAFTEGEEQSPRGRDPYGPIKVNCMPRSRCRVTIEQAYEELKGSTHCCNPSFFRGFGSVSEDSIRLTVARRSSAFPGSGDSDPCE